MSLNLVFASNNFKFRWKVIPCFNTLVKIEFLAIYNLKKVDRRYLVIMSIIGMMFISYDEFFLCKFGRN